MFAVFDVIRKRDFGDAVSEEKVLKLVLENHVLEQISLDALTFQARLDQESQKSRHIPDEQLRYRIIVKKPLMAIRYQLPDGHIRRIQMNFRPDAGFDSARGILESHGLQIQDQDLNISLFQQPSSQSSSAPMLPHTGSQSNYRGLDRNSIPQPWPLTQTLPISSMLQGTTTQSAPLGREDWISSSAQAFTDLQLPTDHTPRVVPAIGIAQDDFSKLLVPRTQESGSSKSSNPVNEGPVRFPQLSTADMMPQDSGESFPSLMGQSEVYFPDVQRRLFGADSARPVSAPETQSERFDINTIPLSQMLPPKRTLPFPSPKEQLPTRDSEKSEKSKATESQTTKTDAIPPPAKSTKTKAPAKKPAKPRPSSRASTSKAPSKTQAKKPAPNQKSTEKAPAAETPMNATTTSGKRVKVASPVPDDFSLSPEPSQKATENEPNPVKAKKAVKRAPKPSNKPVQDPNAKPTPTPAPAPTPALGPTLTTSINPEEFMTAVDGWVRKYHDIPVPTRPQTSKDLLAEYASRSDEERAKVLDDMICDCLEDENFHKLVKDVENSWRRIGLGF